MAIREGLGPSAKESRNGVLGAVGSVDEAPGIMCG